MNVKNFFDGMRQETKNWIFPTFFQFSDFIFAAEMPENIKQFRRDAESVFLNIFKRII